MEEQIKFTDEEVNKINEIRNQSSLVYQKIGQLSVEEQRRIAELKQAREDLDKQLNDIRETETKFFTELNQKYGDGNYDPETNVFTPISTETQQ